MLFQNPCNHPLDPPPRKRYRWNTAAYQTAAAFSPRSPGSVFGSRHTPVVLVPPSFLQALHLFRNIPSPEHGASTSILSKKQPECFQQLLRVFPRVITLFVQPHTVRFSRSALRPACTCIVCHKKPLSAKLSPPDASIFRPAPHTDPGRGHPDLPEAHLPEASRLAPECNKVPHDNTDALSHPPLSWLLPHPAPALFRSKIHNLSTVPVQEEKGTDPRKRSTEIFSVLLEFRVPFPNCFLQNCEENQITYNCPSCDADNTQ